MKLVKAVILMMGIHCSEYTCAFPPSAKNLPITYQPAQLRTVQPDALDESVAWIRNNREKIAAGCCVCCIGTACTAASCTLAPSQTCGFLTMMSALTCGYVRFIRHYRN